MLTTNTTTDPDLLLNFAIIRLNAPCTKLIPRKLFQQHETHRLIPIKSNPKQALETHFLCLPEDLKLRKR
jgi:hypothetical protein